MSQSCLMFSGKASRSVDREMASVRSTRRWERARMGAGSLSMMGRTSSEAR